MAMHLVLKRLFTASAPAFVTVLMLAAPALVLTAPATSEARSASAPYVVTLSSGERVHAEIMRGAPDRATFVLVNGLVYDLRRWDNLADSLHRQGYTVVRYAFLAQPESLRLLPPGRAPGFFSNGLELADMAKELHGVLDALDIRSKVHLVGLSYGATVAAEFAKRYANAVEATVFVSPLIVPLDFYDTEGRALRGWLGAVRFWENAGCDFYGSLNPWLCLANDYWYDSFYNYFYENYLTTRVKSIPEGLSEATFKKAIFHLVRASRDFDLRHYLPNISNVHMMVASGDDHELYQDQVRAWDDLSPDQRESFWIFNGAQHALPDEAPAQLGRALGRIAEKTPDTRAGRQHEVTVSPLRATR